MNVFSAQRQSGAFVKTSMKFPQWNGCGQRSDDSAWFVLISDVSAMKTNGARKSAAKTIRRLWFATRPGSAAGAPRTAVCASREERRRARRRSLGPLRSARSAAS